MSELVGTDIQRYNETNQLGSPGQLRAHLINSVREPSGWGGLWGEFWLVSAPQIAAVNRSSWGPICFIHGMGLITDSLRQFPWLLLALWTTLPLGTGYSPRDPRWGRNRLFNAKTYLDRDLMLLHGASSCFYGCFANIRSTLLYHSLK